MIAKLKSLIATAIELPGALRECVEAKRAEDARRNSERATEAFEECFQNGPAMYEANSKLDELKAKLAESERELNDTRVRLHNATGRANEAADALSEWQGWAMSKAGSIACSADVELRELIDSTIDDAERKLAREIEARRWRDIATEGPRAMPETRVMWRAVGEVDVWGATVGEIVTWTNIEWRYLSPEDMP